MHMLTGSLATTLGFAIDQWLSNATAIIIVVIGFSIIIFVHELGHFLAAKWMGIRVDRFAIGFFTRVVGWRKGEGVTFGKRPDYSAEELEAKGYGETDYCLNAMPFGGYVKMLGEDDILVNEETGEVKQSEDPRAFTNKSVGRRMVVVSAGVIFNVVFALAVYVGLFMTAGRPVIAPVAGMVEPGSAAAQAGLQPGDRIVRVGDDEVRSFEDFVVERLFGGDEVTVTVKRADTGQVETLKIARAPEQRGEIPRDVAPMLTTEVGGPFDEDYGADMGPFEAGDVITHVNGEPVQMPYEMRLAFERSGGEPVALTVARGGEDGETVRVEMEPVLAFAPELVKEPGATDVRRRSHLLGLERRLRVLQVREDSPAQAAGLQAGDVIVQWGPHLNPLFPAVSKSIDNNGGQPILVVVLRGGETKELTVRPRTPFSLFGEPDPEVGVAFDGENERAVVADVVPATPAAEAGIPPGAALLAIGDTAVDDWFDVFEALKRAAGHTVDVRFRSGADEVTSRMTVPSSIVNELDLPPTVAIVSVGGEQTAQLADGRPVQLPSAIALEKLLQNAVGQTVEVTYREHALSDRKVTKRFTVRQDNVDPWQMRAGYGVEWPVSFVQMKDRVTAGGNPVKALAMSVDQTWAVVINTYAMVRSMLTRDVDVKHVSGPVGIVRLAVHQAKAGTADLLDFMALISVNLAVINFLPIPVLDGGLMVFLILEGIRRKPLNLKVQLATTIAGLALIVLLVVFVTFQDVWKWVNGGF